MAHIFRSDGDRVKLIFDEEVVTLVMRMDGGMVVGITFDREDITSLFTVMSWAEEWYFRQELEEVEDEIPF